MEKLLERLLNKHFGNIWQKDIHFYPGTLQTVLTFLV